MEMTRKMGQAMNVSNVRPPLRQNTFVVEDRNVMRLGEGGEEQRDWTQDRRNGHTSDGAKDRMTTTKRVDIKKPPTKTVATSKTDSGLGGGGGGE